MALPEPSLVQGWAARLELSYERRGERTVLARRQHYGPLLVQRSFYPEGDGCCHNYLIHPPGGVVGGDRLELVANLGLHTHALVTTPAAGKFYRSAGSMATQIQHLRIEDGALLEWLPQETILFAGARVDSLTKVELSGTAVFIGWEILCLGRPASGELFDHGLLRQRLEIWRGDEPLLLERSSWQGGSEAQRAAWGLAAEPVFATMVATGDFSSQLDELREAVANYGERIVLSQLPQVLIVRYLGGDALEARHGFTRIWQQLRPHLREGLAGGAGSLPRIWST